MENLEASAILFIIVILGYVLYKMGGIMPLKVLCFRQQIRMDKTI